MADPTEIPPPVTPPVLPEKEWWKSNAIWGAIVTFVIGFVESNTKGEFSSGLAEYVGQNKDGLIGAVMELAGLFVFIATLRRKTKLKV